MKVWFSKLHGAGNDFIVIDDRANRWHFNPEQVKFLCDRHFGIGADGLIIIRNPSHPTAQFKWEFFNNDGSIAEMCGNGARCVGLYVKRKLGINNQFILETLAGLIHIRFVDDMIGVELRPPSPPRLNMLVELSNGPIELHYINTGVPHVVAFVDDLDKVDVAQIGRQIRFHPIFAPAGTNVNFVKILNNRRIAIRTYERGVEAETFACGTGVTAAALIVSRCLNWGAPIEVIVKSGEILKVNFALRGEVWNKVELIGPATYVFDGEIEF